MRDENISEKPPNSDPVKLQEFNLKRLQYESHKRKLYKDSKEELSAKKAKLSEQKRGTSRNLALIYRSFLTDFPANSNTYDILNPFLEPCLDNLKNHFQAYSKVFGGYDVSTKLNSDASSFSKGSVILSLRDENASSGTVNTFFTAEFKWVPSKQKVVLFEGKDSKISLKDFCFSGVCNEKKSTVFTIDNGVCLELNWINEIFLRDQMFSESKVKILDLLKERWNSFYDLKRQIDNLLKLKFPPELKKYTVLLSSWRAISISLDDSIVYKTHFKRGHFSVEGTVQVSKRFPEIPPQWEFAESQTLKKAGISLGGLKSEVNTRFFGKTNENVLYKQVALILEVLSSIYDGLSSASSSNNNGSEREGVIGRDRRPPAIIKE